MAKATSKLEQLRRMREAKPKPRAKVSVIAKARKEAKEAKAAKPARAAKPAKASKNGNSERGAKSLAIAEMLKRTKGCTRKDALEATGWPSVSLQAMADQLGIKLRVEKVPGEPTRYFGA